MTTTPPYICRQFVEDVTAYLEDALPDDVVATIEAHLVDCPHCREYLDEMRQTIAMAGALATTDVDTMPSELHQRLMDAFREAGIGDAPREPPSD